MNLKTDSAPSLQMTEEFGSDFSSVGVRIELVFMCKVGIMYGITASKGMYELGLCLVLCL